MKTVLLFVLAVATTASSQSLNLIPMTETALDVHASKTFVYATGHWISTDGQHGVPAVSRIECERRTMTCTDMEATAADKEWVITLQANSTEYKITRWTDSELDATGVTSECKLRLRLVIFLKEGHLVSLLAPSEATSKAAQTCRMIRATSAELKGGTSFRAKR
jgi:hypothetical protein